MKRELPSSEHELVQVSGGINVREAGRRGGRATLKNKGIDFFKRIGTKGGRRTAELYREVLAEFGRKGGRPRRPKLGEPAGERDQQ